MKLGLCRTIGVSQVATLQGSSVVGHGGFLEACCWSLSIVSPVKGVIGTHCRLINEIKRVLKCKHGFRPNTGPKIFPGVH